MVWEWLYNPLLRRIIQEKNTEKACRKGHGGVHSAVSFVGYVQNVK